MTQTFNPSLSDDISQVRQHIGDTGATSTGGPGYVITGAQIEDETITAYLGRPLSVLWAASKLAYDLSSKWAGRADVNVDDQLMKVSMIAKNYAEMGARLAVEARQQDGPQGGNTGASGFGPIMVTGLTDRRGPLDNCPESAYDFPDCC